MKTGTRWRRAPLSRRWRAHRSSGRAPCRRRGAHRRTARISRTSRNGGEVRGAAPACRRGLHPRDYVAAGIIAEGQTEALRVVVAKRILASLTVMVCMALPMDMKRADRSFQLIRLTQLRHTDGNFPGKVRHLRTHGAAGSGRTADLPLRRLLGARARHAEGCAVCCSGPVAASCATAYDASG